MQLHPAPLLVLLVSGTAAKTVDMFAPEEFESIVFTDKASSFIKFFAPWCGHCQAMAPAWKELGDGYVDAEDTLIGEVDCTVAQDLCTKYNVEGYPTLKYVQAGDDEMQEYSGEMDATSLQSFAAGLMPACTPSNRKSCTASQMEQLDSFMAMSQSERNAELTHRAKPLLEETAKLEALNERLEKLEEKQEEQEELVQNLKASIGPMLRLLRSTGAVSVASSPSTQSTRAVKDEI